MVEYSAQIVLYDRAVDHAAFRSAVIGLLEQLKAEGVVGDFVLKAIAPVRK